MALARGHERIFADVPPRSWTYASDVLRSMRPSELSDALLVRDVLSGYLPAVWVDALLASGSLSARAPGLDVHTLLREYAPESAHAAEVRGWKERGETDRLDELRARLITVLGGLRAVLDAEARNGFPRASLERELSRQGKALRFDPLELDDLLDLKYGATKTFALLALLYPGTDVRTLFHLDHVYPKSRFTAARLRAAGIPDDDIPTYLDRVDRLANLQLLEGAENVDKRAALPSEWVQRAYPDPATRSGYLARNDLADLPPLSDFLSFYDQRRARMRERLLHLLGVDPSAPSSQAALPAEEGSFSSPAASSSHPGSVRRDIGRHILSAFTSLPPGSFLTVNEIRHHRSDEYGDEFPSAGAIAARLFPSTGRCTVPGVEPGTSERGVRGARKA